MSEAPRPGPRTTDRWLEPGPTNIQVIYILYLLGFVIGITPLVGIVMAHINRGKTGGWIETHYTWAIRTFWLGMAGALVSFVLMFVLIGFVLMLAIVLWFVLRMIIGLQAVSRGEPIRDPQSWLI